MLRPPISCRTLAVFDFMRVPPPAASTITVRSLDMGTNLIPVTHPSDIVRGAGPTVRFRYAVPSFPPPPRNAVVADPDAGRAVVRAASPSSPTFTPASTRSCWSRAGWRVPVRGHRLPRPRLLVTRQRVRGQGRGATRHLVAVVLGQRARGSVTGRSLVSHGAGTGR